MAMRGFVAVTDPGWWARLSRLGAQLGPIDANFWAPSTRNVLLPPGTPFIFKLKAPANAIAGFGYFTSFSILPEWLAWDTFGEANGVADLAELRSKISRIQKGARIDADLQHRIGCSLIAEAVFFAKDAWVKAPSDWKPRTVSGASTDLTVGEGLRIWRECLERVSGVKPTIVTPSPRYGTPATYLPRLGQGIFRVQVLDAYARACAVTREHSLVVLDAAHLKPYGDGGEHAVSNGLALRTDLHRLLDRGYITIDETVKLVVGGRLKADYDNGKAYYEMHGRALKLPMVAGHRPGDDVLRWHRENVFLG